MEYQGTDPICTQLFSFFSAYEFTDGIVKGSKVNPTQCYVEIDGKIKSRAGNSNGSGAAATSSGFTWLTPVYSCTQEFELHKIGDNWAIAKMKIRVS